MPELLLLRCQASRRYGKTGTHAYVISKLEWMDNGSFYILSFCPRLAKKIALRSANLSQFPAAVLDNKYM